MEWTRYDDDADGRVRFWSEEEPFAGYGSWLVATVTWLDVTGADRVAGDLPENALVFRYVEGDQYDMPDGDIGTVVDGETACEAADTATDAELYEVIGSYDGIDEANDAVIDYVGA